MALTEEQAMKQPCIGPENCGKRDADGVRRCIGSACALAWRWASQESARSTTACRVDLQQQETPFKGVHFHRYHKRYTSSMLPDKKQREELDKFLKNWSPAPPDKKHDWTLKDKVTVNLGSPGGFTLVATFERDKLPSERDGYCGLAGRPR